MMVTPTFLGVFTQAKWVKCESTDTPRTSQLMLWNSLALSLNEIISVGQTKVLETGERKKKKKSVK